MYKVFHSTYHVIFSSEKLDDKYIIVENLKEIEGLIDDTNSSFLVLSNNPYNSLQNCYKSFKTIEAAGGVVKKDNSYLWIFRNNKWDLPKGKVELNEKLEHAAIREVREECGLDDSLEIKSLLYTSFHVYSLGSKNILKKTYWFLMDYKGIDVLRPQLEEGITKVVWVNKNLVMDYSKKSFGNVQEVCKVLKV